MLQATLYLGRFQMISFLLVTKSFITCYPMPSRINSRHVYTASKTKAIKSKTNVFRPFCLKKYNTRAASQEKEMRNVEITYTCDRFLLFELMLSLIIKPHTVLLRRGGWKQKQRAKYIKHHPA